MSPPYCTTMNADTPERLYKMRHPSGLQEEPEANEAEGDEAAHNYSISSLLGRYPPNQCINPRHLTCRHGDPPINACQRLPL